MIVIKLNIGGLVPKIPLIQGGMAVGVSLDNLAAAVANEGGIGVIGTAGIGMLIEGYQKRFKEANVESLKKVIRSAKKKTNGIIGVNIMVALTDYADMVKTAIKEKVDVIISGAGLPLQLPSFLEENTKTKLIPVVSSVKAAQVIFKRWIKKYNYIPDAFIVEGPKAGGHLGYNKEDLENPEYALEKSVKDIVLFSKEIEKKYGKKVPVIAAGGIDTHEQVEKFFKLGASGIQVGTPFIATKECDADIKFKEAIIASKKEDMTIIKSPVGLPGRAVRNKFLEDVERGMKKPFTCAYHCIKTCKFKEAPYCIAEALMNAARGNLENGFVFSGANGYKINKITTVKEVINNLIKEGI